MANRVGGIIEVKLNGQQLRAKGDFDYNVGRPMREAVVGTDSVHGYKETPQVSFIQGEVTHTPDLDLDALLTAEQATVTLTLGNGKVIVLRDAWFAGEGTANTGEGNIAVRFEGMDAEEV